jgi:2-polyprenyl-3-methyl-5-hydroxy-6-metoxy-1,4-benzoquinol methylase
MRLVDDDPGHEHAYVARFRRLAEEGADLYGEARLVDAMLLRSSRVLDAGCGFGRIGGFLARVGHEVVGVDVDARQIEAARQDHPEAHWVVADVATLDLPALGIAEPFDAIVCAGNVLPFVAPDARMEVLRRFRRHLRPDGRAVIGFAAERGYAFDAFLTDAKDARLVPELLLSSWHLRPFTESSDFLVALLLPV